MIHILVGIHEKGVVCENLWILWDTGKLSLERKLKTDEYVVEMYVFRSIMEEKSFMRRSAPLLCQFSSSNILIVDLVAEVAVAWTEVELPVPDSCESASGHLAKFSNIIIQ